jgi:tetratricopeptide (TPR) repeat protein
MKTFFIYFGLCLSFLLAVTQATAATSADYYHAGVKLYTAQNYAQAVRYFSAAIQLDPNNTAALQGRGNCHYAQGEYSDALADYQRVQALSPSDGLAQFIAKVQAKVGATPAAAAPIAAPASNPYFDQGVSYFQQKQYAPAAQAFQKAAQQDPNNYKPYYYLGFSQMMLGDYKNAAVALGICNLKHPNDSIASYTSKLKARLSIDDGQWVDSQIYAARVSGSSNTYVVSNQYATPNTFGIRLEPYLQTYNITGLQTLEQYNYSLAQTIQQSIPNTTYTATVPQGSLAIGLEPTYRITSNIELGLPIVYNSIGSYQDQTTAIYQGVTVYSESATLTFTDISFGLNGRYFINTGDLQPFVGAGLSYHMVSLTIPTPSTTSSSGYSSTTTTNSLSTSGIGFQGQLGVDWHFDSMFSLSLFAGYQLANMGSTWSANGQTGNLFGALTGNYSSSSSSSSSSSTSSSSANSADNFDMSGPFGGIEVSISFH